MQIVKADGTRESFDRSKLEQSLTRSGASRVHVEHVADNVEKKLREGMSTREIYKDAFSILKHLERPAASRYSMRRAILDLGPTGFPFEDFVAEIFKARGFHTETDKIVNGVCVTHEIDLIATKEGKCVGAEVKFHNRIGMKSDLQTALYVHARFLDIIDKVKEKGGICAFDEGWLITNTKFSSDAITYGECAGLTMVGWNYPSGKNLQDMIEETKVHPLTALTKLSKREKTALLQNKVVLCKTLQDKQNVMHNVGIKGPKIDEILKESDTLCQP